MKLKKSVLGFIICILYAILIVVIIGQNLYTMVQKVVISNKIEDLFPCFVIITILLVLFLMKLGSGKISKSIKLSNRGKIFIEVSFIIVIFTAAILLRMQLAFNTTLPLSDNLFFKLASVQQESTELYMDNNASMLYRYALSFVMSLFGNREAVCRVFQAALQCLTLCFLYVSVKNISGVFAAIAAAAAFAVLPVFVSAIDPLGPEMLVLSISLFLFWLMSVIWKHNSQGGYQKPYHLLVFMLVGVLTGAVVFISPVGLVFLVIALVLIVLSNTETEKSRCSNPWLKDVVLLAGVMVGCAAMVIWKSAVFAILPIQPVMEYITMIQDGGGFTLQKFLPAINDTAAPIILLAAGAWIVGYRRADREEALPYILFLAGTIVLYMMLPNTLNYELFVLTAWIIAASVGVKSILKQYPEKEGGKSRQRQVGCTGSPVIETNLLLEPIPPVLLSESPVTELKKPIQYITNPLPVPKKHVKKEMNYAFTPKESQMHFEIEDLKENDDFDLKDI